MKYLLIILLAYSGLAFADNHLIETRYCGVQRDDNGRIKRSARVVKEFEKLYPLPTGYDRSQWQVNHSVPLVCGGCDAVRNLIWMRKEAKTCAEDWCQDRHEQLTMCHASYMKNN